MKKNKLYIAFRVDASVRIGTGHFMRCFTLAKELLNKNTAITFICRNSLPALYRLLEQNGIEIKQLPVSPIQPSETSDVYSEWLGTTQTIDAEATINALSGTKIDWLIVDHYALDNTWEQKLKNYTDKLMVIDDLANRKHVCDLLLDQNYYHDDINPYQDLVRPGCQLLLGPKYALLRPEFQQLRHSIKKKESDVKRVLIFFGGVDIDDMTSKAMEAISNIKVEPLIVDVVIGDQHPNKSFIVHKCQQQGYHCHIQTTKMAELIAQADLCIGAGGSTTWERCALGLPTITFSTAENQQNLTTQAATAGMVYAPIPGENLVETIRLHFMALYNNPLLRQFISNNSMKLVDGAGALRVIQELMDK